MKHLKSILTGVLALAVVFAIGFGMRDHFLKASDEEGGTTAVEQQETVKEASAPVEVAVPEKEEKTEAEPAAEEKAEESAAEEPAAEESAAEEVSEEPAAAQNSVKLSIHVVDADSVSYGDKVTLQVDVKANCEYCLQWQVKTDKEWNNIKGETGDKYSFVLTEDNADNEYRVVATAA